MPDDHDADPNAPMHELEAPAVAQHDDVVDEVADASFPVALRGYDREAVDAYVHRVTHVVAELQAMRSPEDVTRRALDRVGEETASILQRAHDTAEDITARSRSQADDRVEGARREADALRLGAEARVRQLDVETDRIWDERERIVADARVLAERLMTLVEEASQSFAADEGVEAADADAPQGRPSLSEPPESPEPEAPVHAPQAFDPQATMEHPPPSASPAADGAERPPA